MVVDGWPVWQPSLLALGLTVAIGCCGHAVGVTCLGFGTSKVKFTGLTQNSQVDPAF